MHGDAQAAYYRDALICLVPAWHATAVVAPRVHVPYSSVAPHAVHGGACISILDEILASNLLLFQFVGCFGKFRSVDFAINLDIYIVSTYIVKFIYLDLAK
jgi:hypothetical protein